MEGEDPAAIDSAAQSLTTASHKLAEAIYKKTTESASGEPSTSGEGNGGEAPTTDEKVVDAEFEEVDKEKK